MGLRRDRVNRLDGVFRAGCLVCGLLLLLIAGYRGELRAQERSTAVEATIEDILKQSPQQLSFWSISVRDTTGAFLYRHNAHKLIRPASNLKLLTSGMLLEILGPDYQYETPMYGVGKQRDSLWIGDVLFIGKGDPSISGTYYNANKLHVFESFYQVLDSLGIKKITGSIIGNDSYFEQKPYPEGWDWNDLSFYYAVEINALSFNGNTVDLDVHADGDIGDTPRISWFPFNTDYVRFINEQVITPPQTEFDESYRRVMGTNTIILKSKLPKNYFEEEPLSVSEPSRYFVDTFKKYLQRRGIEVQGGTIVDHEPIEPDTSTYHLFKTHTSHRMDTLIYQINRESSNFYTEMMLRTSAAEHYDTRGSTSLGLKMIRDFAAGMSIDTARLNITDGSGMAGGTLTTTFDLSSYMLLMRKHKHYKPFFNSLSVAGKNGTFDYRFTDSPITGNLRGKSGYISGVRTLSGYLTTASGEKLIVSMATNNYTAETKVIEKVQEKILEYLYRKY